MYKINNDVYIRATDDLNFIVSRKNGINKKGEEVFFNIAYFNSIYFINEYCKMTYDNDLFEDLLTITNELIDFLDNSNSMILLLNSYDREDEDRKEVLSCEIEVTDLSRCYKTFYNDSLNGYFPKLHQSWKSLLTVYVLRMMKNGIPLNKIEKEIKTVLN